MKDQGNKPVAMTRRQVVTSIASIGTSGALGALGPLAMAQSTPPIPQRSDFTGRIDPNVPNKWRNIYWGTTPGITWKETITDGTPGGKEVTLSLVLDITIPPDTVPVPPGGRPVIAYFHASGDTKNVSDTGPIGAHVRIPALAAGFAFVAVEFRHHRTNADQMPGCKNDAGEAIQYIRNLHVAFDLDRDNIFAICRSRGNVALWQSLQPDLAISTATTYAGRQSSLLKGVWSLSGQATYINTRWADLFIDPNDPGYAQWLIDNPSHPAAGSAIDSIATATAAQVPDLIMQHELPYWGVRLPLCEPNPNKPAESAVNDEHLPDNGRVMRDAYIANGYRDRILTIDKVLDTNDPNQLVDCVPWVLAVKGGARAVEAWAMVRAQRRGAGLYYARTGGMLGLWTAPGGSTVPAIGGAIGHVVDGSYGLTNRGVAGASQLGAPAGQSLANNKPILAQFANGKYGIQFDGNDRLTIALSSSTAFQACYSWTATTEYSSPAVQNSTYIAIGYSPTAAGNMANQTMSLCVAQVSASPPPIDANDLKGFRQFANLLAGTSFYIPEVPVRQCTAPI